MAELFREFWTLSDPNVVWVLYGAALLGITAGTIGCFAFLRKRALIGDTLAHAALPGVTMAFLLTNSRDPLVILVGATISCFLGYFALEYIIKHTIIKEDSAFAIVLSLFFAFGIFQLTYIQKLPIASQAGLDKLLFGQASALVGADVKVLIIVATIVLSFVAICFRELKITAFDPAFGRSIGMPIGIFELLIALCVVLTVAIGLQLVGVVLMAAMLLTPPAAARYWTESLVLMIVLAGLFGALAGIVGANISYLAPRMPTGPWMVLVITFIFGISFLFAPARGVVARQRRRLGLKRRIARENILRTMFKLAELQGNFNIELELDEILSHRSMRMLDVQRALSSLARESLVEFKEQRIVLTQLGLKRAEELTRFHRLWELYLATRAQVASDHVHAEAEAIEHLLTPELVEELTRELNSPQIDPHGREIPK